MSTSITRRIPFSTYEFEALESWLCHMAKEGFSLQSTFMAWAFLKRGRPCLENTGCFPRGFVPCPMRKRKFMQLPAGTMSALP